MNRDSTQPPPGHDIAALTAAPDHPALTHLVDALREKYADCVAAVLFYGSCLRSGDPYDGLVDLYLLVDNYRCANPGPASAFWNKALPPNVFYAEFDHGERTVRCKYAIIALADLEKGTSKRWFHSYLWGRFSQPTAIAWSRDAQCRARVEHCLAQAVVTFLNRVLPALPERGTVASLWRDGLQLSYRAELRAESSNRSRELSEAGLSFYEQATTLSAGLLDYPLDIDGAPLEKNYSSKVGALPRLGSRLAWATRIAQGKLLSVARLLKALFTFEGGLDYIAWKLERHSGVHVEIPDCVRRYPLIFIWGLFWDLYRRGAFR